MCSPVSPVLREASSVIAPELPLRDVAVIALQLLLGVKLCAVIGQLARFRAGHAGRGRRNGVLTGLLLRPQIFSPTRRSSLYFEVVRFVMP